MSKPWQFLVNPFLTVGSKSRPKAIKLSTYTYGALEARQADAFFGPEFLIYKPLQLAVLTEDAQWKTQIGTQKGSTASLDGLLEQLSPGKVYGWDLAVQNVYAKGTPGYIAVFPQGHKPFQHGGKDERVLAVETLSGSLGVATAPPTFVPIKTDVDAFLLLMQNARTAQSGAKSTTGTESDQASAAITAAMVGLYKFLGLCINRFGDNPTSIEPLFDLETLRSIEQTLFINHVLASATKNIVKRTLLPTDRVRIKVNSVEPLTFFIVEEANDAPGAVSVTVQGSEEEIVNASQLGNVPSASYLKVQNLSALLAGEFEVELL